jgi:hypothetical protein
MKTCVMAVFLLMAFNLNAEEGAVDYKCYLKTSFGHEIGFYRWHEKLYVQEVAKLIASKMQTADGDVYIKEVIECTKLDQDFGRPDAILLDKKTVR